MPTERRTQQSPTGRDVPRQSLPRQLLLASRPLSWINTAFPFAAESRWWAQHIADLPELADELE